MQTVNRLSLDPVSSILLRLIVAVELALGERDPTTLLYLKSESQDSENMPQRDLSPLERCVSDGDAPISPPSDPSLATL